MIKEHEIFKYSNPEKVIEKSNKEFGHNKYELQLSTRKDKKYMIRGDFTDNKWIHFGQYPYQDYTKHNDERRRELFKKRNHKWEDMPVNSPAYLSYTLLW